MAFPTHLAESAAERQQSASSNSCSNSVVDGHYATASSDSTSLKVYSQILRQCAASICHSVGFHSIQNASLDTLAVLLHQFLSRTCQSSRSLCEHTGRSLVNAGDVFMALVDQGRPDLTDFAPFLCNLRRNNQRQFSLVPQSSPKVLPVLRIADPRPHPTHFPNFLPPFPDPHTYIRSEVRDETDTNYERVRRLDAQNKRDWEQSLEHYALTQYPTVSVFRELESRLMFEAKDAVEKQRNEHRRPPQFDQPKRQQSQLPSGAIVNGVMAQEGGTDPPPSDGLGIAAGHEVPTVGCPEEILLPPTEDEEEELLPDTEKGDEAGTDNAVEEVPPTKASEQQRQINNGGGGIGPSPEELLIEELFHPVDTERSFVLRHIPHFCHILLPFADARPYLCALLTDDADQAADDEQHNDYFARMLSKEMDEDDGGGGMETEETGGGGINSTTTMEMGGGGE